MASRLLGQDQNPFYKDTITVVNEKCSRDFIEAETDFENGTFVIEMTKPIPFSDTQQKILSNRYGVNVIFKDGVMTPNYDCYNYHLKTLVKQKWGYDIFKRSNFTADSLDRVGLGDQSASFKFKGGFLEFLRSNLSSDSKRMIRQVKDLKTLYIRLDVSESGFTDNVTILNSLHHGEIEVVILELVKGKELWIPKKDDGQGLRTWVICPIEIEKM